MLTTLKIFSFLICCCICFAASAAEAPSVHLELIRADELAQLSPADQQQALRIVSTLAAGLDKTTEGHAFLQRLELLMPSLANAASYQGDAYQASAEALEKFKATGDIYAARDSLALLIAEVRNLQDAGQPIPDKLKTQFEQTYSTVYARVDSSEKDIVTKYQSVFNNAIGASTSMMDSGSRVDSSADKAPAVRRPAPVQKSAVAHVTSMGPTTPSGAAYASVTAPVASGTTQPVADSGKAISAALQSTTPKVAPPVAIEKTIDTTKHCISSGFVLSVNPRGRCNFIHSLNQTGLSSILPFDESKFVCSGDTVLCNPLLFGFTLDSGSCPATTAKDECWKKARPICAPNQSQSLTKTCQGVASSQNLKNAVDFIQNRGGKIWDDYQQSLVSLCNSKGNSTDVTETCKVAVEQMTILKKQVQSPTAPAAAGEGKR